MAGAGYKLFNTGDVLTAAQVNTYLQEQAVMRFASAAARTTALSGVLAEGMMSYLDDTNSVEVYNGSAWVSIGSTGDIEGVTAGVGISGGGTSGTVTVTNSMATAIDAKGDIIAGTGADAFARLPVGTNNLFLSAASGETTGLKWAGDWVSWTPTLNNITIGNGTRTGKYARIGNTVIFWLKITLGSTSSVSNEPGFQFPVTAAQGYPQQPLVNFVYEDSGGTRWTGSSDPIGNDTTNCRFWVGVASGTYLTTSGLSSTVPFTWGTSDVFWATGIYEVS